MDLDLKDGWEKKALIVAAVIVVIIFAYAFNPFKPATNITTLNETAPQTTAPTTVAPTPTTTNTSNNTANTTVSTLITADQAKVLAESVNKGYKAGTPIQGTVVINGTTMAVWIVPVKSGSLNSKNVYVDISTGRIVQQT